ncbi:MAG: peptide/nickel transport system ATP-binding protein [Candidatus Latescibacterota bacterium]|jgi:peptide/nickel transport system ATP-binding protein
MPEHPPSHKQPNVNSILSIKNLHTQFFLDEGTVRAVDGVNLEIPRGKTLCVVGESGCGKSITALSILQMIQRPGRLTDGSVILHQPSGDVDLTKLPPDGKEMRKIRGAEIAMIFQEPMTSLSPVHTVGSQIAEAVRLHMDVNKRGARERAVDIMERVGIPDSGRRFDQYSHEMSGGLRQRAMIAMALSCRPQILIADEPTTALDVTIQAQILALMRELQQDLDMAILLITHDLGVVAQMADEVAVMYWGRVVEYGHVERIFADPQHPYTEALMRSLPGMHIERKSLLEAIRGTVPDPFQSLEGCAFHPRCDECKPGLCDVGERPQLHAIEEGHLTACLRRGEGAT